MFNPYNGLHSLKMTRSESKHFGVVILYILVVSILLVLFYIIINLMHGRDNKNTIRPS